MRKFVLSSNGSLSRPHWRRDGSLGPAAESKSRSASRTRLCAENKKIERSRRLNPDVTAPGSLGDRAAARGESISLWTVAARPDRPRAGYA